MTRISPMREPYQKAGKPVRDARYLDRVRGLPCCICEGFGMLQNSPTEAHHCKSGRYGSLRTSDLCAIPLCHSHHNKLRAYPGDEGKIGYHNGQATWEALYGPDTDYIAPTQDKIG